MIVAIKIMFLQTMSLFLPLHCSTDEYKYSIIFDRARLLLFLRNSLLLLDTSELPKGFIDNYPSMLLKYRQILKSPYH